MAKADLPLWGFFSYPFWTLLSYFLPVHEFVRIEKYSCVLFLYWDFFSLPVCDNYYFLARAVRAKFSFF